MNSIVITHLIIDSKQTRVFNKVSYGKFYIIIDKKTGYVNISELCRQYGKKFKNFITTNKIETILDRISEECDNISFPVVSKNRTIKGIYVHPDLTYIATEWIDNNRIDNNLCIILRRLFNELHLNRSISYKLKTKKINIKLDF
jgi:hypothetical protein